ncbi:MAG: ABC transporter ATP-binding protein [Anaerolineae bacterium]|nr:ABC transporter ATP-binding protein [Anaerolineae bacterium]
MSIKPPDLGRSNGTLPSIIAASPYPDPAIALSVQGVSKTFGKEKQRRSWSSRLRRNGQTASQPNGKEGKPAESGVVVAVDNISMTIARGEIFGVLGPNGSGKSTLIRCVSTLLLPDSGEVKIFGYDVEKDEMAVKRLINRVSVEASFFKKLSPMENLMYAARLYGMSPADAAPEAKRILERLDLPARTYKQPIEDLSRGQQQKIAIARALLTSPVLLLLDEPTTGLDPRSKFEVQTFIEELRDTHDATILLTTHDMYEADALCDHVAVVHDGRVVARGTPAELKARVANGSGKEVTLEDVFMALTGKELVAPDDAEPVL